MPIIHYQHYTRGFEYPDCFQIFCQLSPHSKRLEKNPKFTNSTTEVTCKDCLKEMDKVEAMIQLVANIFGEATAENAKLLLETLQESDKNKKYNI